VLSLVGFGAGAPLASADTGGFTATVTHNGAELEDGAVVTSGDTLTLDVQYTSEVGDGGTRTVVIPQGVSVDTSSLEVTDDAIDTITHDGRDVVFTFSDPFLAGVDQGSHALELTVDEVDEELSRTLEWSVNGTSFSQQVTVTSLVQEQQADSSNATEDAGESEGAVSSSTDVVGQPEEAVNSSSDVGTLQTQREVTITEVSFGSESIQDYTRESLSVTWEISEGAVDGDITFTLPLPDELHGFWDEFLVYFDGERAGTVAVREDSVTVTIDEAFIEANPAQISGSFYFDVESRIQNNEDIQHDFVFDEITESVTVTPSENWCDENCEFDGHYQAKWGWYDNSDDTITWTVRVPAPEQGIEAGQQIVVTDLMDEEAYESITDGDLPAVYEADSLIYNEWGNEVPNWERLDDDLVEWSNDDLTATFTSREGAGSDLNNYDQVEPGEPGSWRGIDGTLYDIEWEVRPLTGGELQPNGDRVFYNTAEWSIGDESGNIDDGSATRYSGGGDVIGTNFGRFSVTKDLAGDTTLDPEFTINYTVIEPGQDARNVSVTLSDGETYTSPEYFRGAEIEINEIIPTEPENVTWEDPVFTWVDSDGDTQTADAPWRFTIDDQIPAGTLTEITLQNEANLDLGSVALEKELVNEGDLEVGQDAFTIDYSWDADDALGIPAGEGEVDLPANGTRLEINDLPIGANVTFTERGPTDVDNATWSVDTDPETVTIGDDEDVTVTVTNTLNAHNYAVGDYVWIDTNRDGLQDDDEEPLADVTVELYTLDSDGNPSEEPLETTETDENGRYIFDELPAGDYQIRFVQPDGYIFTGQNTQEDGSDEDSDADVNTGWTEVFTLSDDNQELTQDYTDQPFEASHGVDPTWDAGFIEMSYAIGDYVWIDDNRDGLQGDDEEPLADVTVVLYEIDAEGNQTEVERTETDENGRYIFDELPAGDYQVGFILTEEQEAIYTFTNTRVGDDAADDSDAERVTGLSEVFTLDDETPGRTQDYDIQEYTATQGIDPTWDAGVVTKSYAVGDYVWIDSDRDGQQGADEDPLPGVTVELYEVDEEGNRSEEPVATTTTDGNGRYIFDELPAGDYQVRFILTDEQAELYEFTATSGEDSTVDSNAGEDGFSAVFTLDETNEFLTADEDYEHNTVLATQGIDPTWDAGVVLLEEPSEGEEPPAGGEEPPTQEDSAERDDSPSGPDPADSSGQLPSTGVGIGLWAALIAGLLVLAGSAMALIARSNRAQS